MTDMASAGKRKKDRKAVAVRVVSLTLAALMLLSVVMASVWRW